MIFWWLEKLTGPKSIPKTIRRHLGQFSASRKVPWETRVCPQRVPNHNGRPCNSDTNGSNNELTMKHLDGNYSGSTDPLIERHQEFWDLWNCLENAKLFLRFPFDMGQKQMFLLSIAAFEHSEKHEYWGFEEFARVKGGCTIGISIGNIIRMLLAALKLVKPRDMNSQSTFDDKVDLSMVFGSPRDPTGLCWHLCFLVW